MGITGLLPFLQKSSHRAHVRDYSGCTVAIDAYCWLHKGAFSCAEKLVMNEPTTQYVKYCMKYVNMLLSHNIKPILVFDGQNLPAKAGTEQKRRQNRDVNRRKGMELIRAGRVPEGRNILRRALDVTHLMALEVMKECRRINVDCIVAPYEADAQLAFFSITDIAHVIITEDSDLMLFGCKTVMFKMDLNGSGVVVERSKLYLSMGVRQDQFTLDKFRLMAILSGCDYVDSLPGIGLAKACKFITRTAETDIFKCLEKLAVNLNMWTLEVTDEYKQSVVDADHTFRCQLVFDHKGRKQAPLTKPRDGEGPVGEMKEPAIAFQLALGNLNPKNLQRVDNFDPDKHHVPRNTPGRAPHASIWSANYTRPAAPKQPLPTILHHSTAGKTVHAQVQLSPAQKREVEEDVNEEDTEMVDMDLLRLYTRGSKRSKVAPLTGPLQISRYFASNQSDKENISVIRPTPSTSDISMQAPSTSDFFTEDEESNSTKSLSSDYDTAKSSSSSYETPQSTPDLSASESRAAVLSNLEKLDILSANEEKLSQSANFSFSETEASVLKHSPQRKFVQNETIAQLSPPGSFKTPEINDESLAESVDISKCEEYSNNDRLSSPSGKVLSPPAKSESSRPALKAFHSKATSGQLAKPFHPAGALAKLEKSAAASEYFKPATVSRGNLLDDWNMTEAMPIRTAIGKARTSGLSKNKKSAPPAKQNTLAKFGFQVLPKISGTK